MTAGMWHRVRAGSGGWRALGVACLVTALAGCTEVKLGSDGDLVFESSASKEDVVASTVIKGVQSLDLPIGWRPAPSSRALAAAAVLPTDGNGSAADRLPTAPFLGNRTILSGGSAEDATNTHGATYFRMSDCSLTQFVGDSQLRVAGPIVEQYNGVDQLLRAVAGLPALSTRFANGCVDDPVGVSDQAVAYLGRTATGDLVAAAVDINGRLVTGRADVRARVQSFSALATRVAPNLVAADLNGDGVRDLVAAFADAAGGLPAGLRVYRSRADGSLQDPLGFALPGIRFLARASIADMNGDGRLDIVALSGSDLFGGTLSVFLGNPAGGFDVGPVRANAGQVAAFVLVDADGDGRRDVVTAAGAFLRGNGDGSVAAPVRAWTSITQGQQLAFGHLDGNDHVDIVTVSAPSGGIVTVLRGQGDGTFTVGRSYAATIEADTLGITDVDGDGTRDVVVGLVGPGLYSGNAGGPALTQFLLGRGDGTLIGADALPSPSLSGAGPSDRAPVALADIDGTGRDVLLTPEPRSLDSGQPSGNGRLLLRRTAADGTTSEATIGIEAAAAVLVAFGDVNGDGRPDAIYASRDRVGVVRGAAGGAFSGEASRALDNDPTGLAVGDFDGDGRADVALLQVDTFSNGATAGAAVYFGQADGSLAAPVRVDAAPMIVGLAVGRLDGDARADLVLVDAATAGGASRVRSYRGNGDRTFTAGAPLAPGIAPTAVALGDLDGDNDNDLVVAAAAVGNASALFVYPGAGDGSFGSARVHAFGVLADAGADALAVDDVNGDGRADVVSARAGATSFLLGTGDGAFRVEYWAAIGDNARNVATGDLDGDDQRDVVSTLALTGLVTLLNRTAEAGTEEPPPPEAPFALIASASNGRVTSGGQVQASIDVMFASDFDATVTFSCANLPANATCSFAPAQLSRAGSTRTTLTLRTGVAATGTAALTPAAAAGGGATMLALAGLLVLPARRRRIARVLGASALAITLAACGGDGGGAGRSGVANPAVPTPAGTYAVQVSAAGGGETRTFTYTLQVD